jgi:hypothetical protein
MELRKCNLIATTSVVPVLHPLAVSDGCNKSCTDTTDLSPHSRVDLGEGAATYTALIRQLHGQRCIRVEATSIGSLYRPSQISDLITNPRSKAMMEFGTIHEMSACNITAVTSIDRVCGQPSTTIIHDVASLLVGIHVSNVYPTAQFRLLRHITLNQRCSHALIQRTMSIVDGWRTGPILVTAGGCTYETYPWSRCGWRTGSTSVPIPEGGANTMDRARSLFRIYIVAWVRVICS